MRNAERIIIALDLRSKEQVVEVLSQIPQAQFVKVGMELFYSTGPDLIATVKDMGLKVFLDLKIHDIPNTAYGAISTLSKLGCDILNLHCAGGLEMMQRARAAVTGDTLLIGVTQLTSTDQSMLNQQLKIQGTVEDCVLHYANLAKQAGLHGVVCSPQEVTKVRSTLGGDLITVTPGVRPAGDSVQDQKRVMTPKDAIQAGSDYLVIGRPILADPHPSQAFARILAEINEAEVAK